MTHKDLIVHTIDLQSRDRLKRAVPDLGREHFEWTATGVRGDYYVLPHTAREVALAINGVAEVKGPISLSVCVKLGA